MKLKQFLTIIISLFFISFNYSNAEILKNIIVKGNDRVSNETIIVFTSAKIGEEINTVRLNEIVNNLYDTNFFENISTTFDNQELVITVKENPIINTIQFKGIKSKTLIENISKNLELKPRSSFNLFILENDKVKIENELKSKGYYYSTIEIFTEKNITFGKYKKINLILKISGLWVQDDKFGLTFRFLINHQQ